MTNSKSISRRTLVSAAAAGTAALGAAFTQQARALPASEVKAWDYEADVVVCGCGTGGSAAAVEAYDQGADVLSTGSPPPTGSATPSSSRRSATTRPRSWTGSSTTWAASRSTSGR